VGELGVAVAMAAGGIFGSETLEFVSGSGICGIIGIVVVVWLLVLDEATPLLLRNG
jgi:hypothetical protein